MNSLIKRTRNHYKIPEDVSIRKHFGYEETDFFSELVEDYKCLSVYLSDYSTIADYLIKKNEDKKIQNWIHTNT